LLSLADLPDQRFLSASGSKHFHGTSILARQPTVAFECLLQEMDAVPDVLGWRVDLVGNTGGELTNRFELARLSQLGLELLAVGDVADHSDEEPLAGRIDADRMFIHM